MTVLSKNRRAELEAELLQTMDELDALKAELREAQAENREQAKLHAQKLKELRDILSGREGEQVLIPGTEAGEVKPVKRRPAKRSDRYDAIGRPRGELTRWICDAQAKRVPNFVIEQTGIRTKAGIIAKWGENAVFELAKPTPKPKSKPDHLARHMAERKATAEAAGPSAEIPWTELEGASHGGHHAQIGASEWRVLEVMPNRLVLESKGARERSWHKEGVFASMDLVEDHVRVKADMKALSAQCGACGKKATEPSEGCDECLHGRAA